MSDPKRCPECDSEMDPDLAQEGICSECGAEFTEEDLEGKREEEREEAIGNGEVDEDEDDDS